VIVAVCVRVKVRVAVEESVEVAVAVGVKVAVEVWVGINSKMAVTALSTVMLNTHIPVPEQSPDQPAK
jgi:hypothetical protein